MATTVSPIAVSQEKDIALIISDSPPVNALSHRVRDGLYAAFQEVLANPAAKAIVLLCEGRTFFAGADITEFGKPHQGVRLPELLDLMENAAKPIVAAIHGTALGGGLETALCAHYRVAVPSARFGLPEVNIGIVPGAGGTQRTARLVGVPAALDMVTSGAHVPAAEALASGLIDAIVAEDDLRGGAIAFAERILAEHRPLVRVRDRAEKITPWRGKPEIFETFLAKNARKFRGFKAPLANVAAIRAAVELPFEEGLAVEHGLFLDLVDGDQAPALRHAFFAERSAAKIPDLPADTPTLPIGRVGILGAGTMGGGIAMAFLNAGLPVTLVETNAEALERGVATIRRNYENSARKGSLKPDAVAARMALLTATLDFDALAACDLVVEAVFENLDLKKEIFARLDRIVRPDAILASNTSYLDVNAIAAATERPGQVLGLHFFSPANVMKLLEIVRGAHTSKPVLATAMALARRLGKIGVLVGVCHGFVGNRMLTPRQTQAQAMVAEGAMPWDIDRVLYDFGFPMGPFAMTDLAGLDIGWSRATSCGTTLKEILCEMGRFGQKSGAGYYDYDESRTARPSPVTEEAVRAFAARSGRPPRAIGDQEIRERTLYPMINEGAKILEEGIAIRASDIDAVWLFGYGWPRYRGGPMYWAEQIGLGTIVERLEDYAAHHGDAFVPSALLKRLAAAGKGFADA